MLNARHTAKSLLALLLVLVSFNVVSVLADDMPGPQAMVKQASDDMLKALKDNKKELNAHPEKIYDLVQKILMPHFDFEKMSKLALGRNWRTASDKQRKEFTEQFRLLLIRTYSTAMLQYTNEEIRFMPFRGDLSSKRVQVDMKVIQNAGPDIPMSLSLYENRNNNWKVYDIHIDGVSLVTNYRSSFANEIRSGGMDKLIDELTKRNEKVKV